MYIMIDLPFALYQNSSCISLCVLHKYIFGAGTKSFPLALGNGLVGHNILIHC